MYLIGVNDRSNELVPYHIALREIDSCDARRVLREARPRLMSWLRLRKSNMALLAGTRREVRGGAMLLIGANDGAHQLVPDNIALVEINE